MTSSDRDILIHRVIARLNVGGPAMHVVLLTREFEGRPISRSTAVTEAEASTSDSGVPAFHARLVAGSVPESEGDMSYFAEERGVEVTRLDAMSRDPSPLDDLRSFFELWRLFRREKPDIVHTHTAKAGALGRLAAALAGVPVRIHTYHGHVLGGDYFSPQKTAFFRGVEQALSVLTQRLVVLTNAQREEMSARMSVAGAEKFAVVPLGLELEPFARTILADGGGDGFEEEEEDGAGGFAAARARARENLGLDPDDIVVGIVGRLVPIKNHELLFDAVPHLLDRLNEAGPDDGPARNDGRPGDEGSQSEGSQGDGYRGSARLRILVVGSGEREGALKEHARRQGIEDHVRWLGWRKDLAGIYPAMDLLALPSKDEGTPVAVIEALAAGVPVVAREVGGVAEVLEDGKWGRLVREPGSTADTATDSAPDALLEAFVDALAATITDPPSPGIRAGGSRSVLDRYGLERLVRDLEAIYVEELERAR